MFILIYRSNWVRVSVDSVEIQAKEKEETFVERVGDEKVNKGKEKGRRKKH